MEALLITAGLLARTILLIAPRPERADILKIGGGILGGIYFAAEAETLIGLPLGFAGVIAFVYKDRILREISEGTLFLYGLLAFFVHAQLDTGASTATLIPDPIGTMLLLYTLFMFGLCVSQIRIGYASQVTLVVLFLASNIYIAYASSLSLLLTETSAVALVLIGFYGLHFVSNVLYLLNLIPVRIGKRQSSQERWQQVRQHAADLEQSYIDVDIHAWRTLGVLFVGLGAFAYSFVFTDWITGLALAFTIGHWLTAPPRESTFTPRAVLRQR